MSTSMNSAVKASIVRKNEVQNKALASVVKHFKRKHRALVTMACGSGKTRVCFMAISSMKAAVSVIAVPTLGLVRQMQDDAVRWMPGEKFDKLLVCSTIRHGDVSESPEDYGLDVTTSPEVILEAISKASKKNRLLIVVTYQSFDKLEAAAKLAKKRRKNIEIGLLVADEAHNTAGESGKKMALCLSDRSVKINKRLFLTATRKVIGQNTKNPQNYNCMDDERVYGKNVFDLSFAEAIKLGITCDYEILNMEVNWKGDDAKKLNTKNYQKSQGRVEELARFLAREMKKNPGMRVFSFHTSVANAEAFNKALLKYKVWSRCITGEMPLTERQAILDEFESSGGSRVICSVRVFGEGVDVPSVDTVVFTDPLTSPIQIAQMVGRGQRIEAGKDMLSVYLPVFHPNGTDSDTAEKTARCSYFKTALKVLRTMSDMDDRLVGEIKNGWDESKKESTGRTRPIFNQSSMSSGFASVVKAIFISKVSVLEPKTIDEIVAAFRLFRKDRPSAVHSLDVVCGRTCFSWNRSSVLRSLGVTLLEVFDLAWPNPHDSLSIDDIVCLFRNAFSERPRLNDETKSAIVGGITVNRWKVVLKNRFDMTLVDLLDMSFGPLKKEKPSTFDGIVSIFMSHSEHRPPLFKYNTTYKIDGASYQMWHRHICDNSIAESITDVIEKAWPVVFKPDTASELISLFKSVLVNKPKTLSDLPVIGGRTYRQWQGYIEKRKLGMSLSEIVESVFPDAAPSSLEGLVAMFRAASQTRIPRKDKNDVVCGKTLYRWGVIASEYGSTLDAVFDMAWPESVKFKPTSIEDCISRLRNDHKRRPSFGEAPCGLTADRWEAIAKRLNTTVEVIMKRAWPDS